MGLPEGLLCPFSSCSAAYLLCQAAQRKNFPSLPCLFATQYGCQVNYRRVQCMKSLKGATATEKGLLSGIQPVIYSEVTGDITKVTTFQAAPF